MEIPLEGHSLTVVSTEYSLVLRSDNGFEIQAEGQVDFETPGGDTQSITFDEHVGFDVKTFFGGKIATAAADSTGELVINMASGNRASVAVDEEFESWSIVGPGGYRIVC